MYTLLEWLSEIGGFYGTMAMFVSFTAGLYNPLVYSVEVVRSNFKIKPKHNQYGTEPKRLDLSKVSLLGQKEVDELLSSTEFRYLKQSFCKMLLLCVPKCIRKTRFKKLIDKGNSKIDQSLDIRTLIETNRAVRVLKKILLNAR
jgi:hypothetical protein